MQDYQDRLSIATPEGVRVDLVLAGLGSRFAAALIDLAIKAVLLLAAVVVAGGIGDLGVALASVAGFVVYIGYDVLFESFAGGRTPGKRLSHLRVLRADGRAVDSLSSAIRNVVRLVDGLALFYVPGMVSILLTARNQRLGDLAGRTIVVRELPVEEADTAPLQRDGLAAWAPAPLVDNGERAPLDVSAVTPQDVAALRAFLARRDQLAGPVRSDLAHRLAGAVRPRVGGGAQGLSPEALIERVVEAKG